MHSPDMDSFSFIDAHYNRPKTALGCMILFKIQKEFSCSFPILIPVTFTPNSYTIYFYGIYILKFLFTFEIELTSLKIS